MIFARKLAEILMRHRRRQIFIEFDLPGAKHKDKPHALTINGQMKDLLGIDRDGHQVESENVTACRAVAKMVLAEVQAASAKKAVKNGKAGK